MNEIEQVSLGVGVHDIPADIYHADPCERPSLSASILHKLLTQSPLHAWTAHPRLNPDCRPESSKEMDVGTAAHDRLLHGPGKVCIVDATDWRTKAAKEARDEARSNGIAPILRKDAINIDRMVKAVELSLAAIEGLGDLLRDGVAEASYVWEEGMTLCRSRLDYVKHDGTIVDYKTTLTAHPDRWSRGHVGPMGYSTQAEFYRRAAASQGLEVRRFIFLVQETKPPYAVSFVQLSDAYQKIAYDAVERGIEVWQRCLESDEWPGYPQAIAIAEPTPWEIAEYEYTLAQEVAR